MHCPSCNHENRDGASLCDESGQSPTFGARPLRAIVDFDEALMYKRRASVRDKERAAPLLDTAIRQFRELGMAGWLRRGTELLTETGGDFTFGEPRSLSLKGLSCTQRVYPVQC